MTVNSSALPQYLNDPVSFKETLGKLASAKTSLSVNSQGGLVPTGFLNNLFKGGSVSSNPRLVELKIMELLVHGKKWMKPEDLKLVSQLAAKAGLFVDKSVTSKDHKELALLVNLIAKEVLLDEAVSAKDCQEICQAFQTHYRNLLKPDSKACEQVARNFEELLKLQNQNTNFEIQESFDDAFSQAESQDAEEQNETEVVATSQEDEIAFQNDAAAEDLAEQNRLDAVASFEIPESTNETAERPAVETEAQSLANAKARFSKINPPVRRTRNNVNTSEENKKIITQTAVGVIATGVTVGGLYALYNSLPNGIAKPIDTTTSGYGSVALVIGAAVLFGGVYALSNWRRQQDQEELEPLPQNPPQEPNQKPKIKELNRQTQEQKDEQLRQQLAQQKAEREAKYGKMEPLKLGPTKPKVDALNKSYEDSLGKKSVRTRTNSDPIVLDHNKFNAIRNERNILNEEKLGHSIFNFNLEKDNLLQPLPEQIQTQEPQFQPQKPQQHQNNDSNSNNKDITLRKYTKPVLEKMKLKNEEEQRIKEQQLNNIKELIKQNKLKFNITNLFSTTTKKTIMQALQPLVNNIDIFSQSKVTKAEDINKDLENINETNGSSSSTSGTEKKESSESIEEYETSSDEENSKLLTDGNK